MSQRNHVLKPFEALIGTWTTGATHPMFDGVVPGSLTFEWLEGGHFIVQRSHNDHETFADAICLIGAPEDGERLARRPARQLPPGTLNGHGAVPCPCGDLDSRARR